MTENDYARVKKIVKSALYGWPVSPEELEEAEQEAAIIAWRVGLDPCTRVWWSARDTIQKIRGSRRQVVATLVPLDGWDHPGSECVEDEVVSKVTIEEALAVLDPKDRRVIQAMYVEGLNTMETARKLGLHDSNVGRRRDSGLQTMRSRIV